MPHNSFLFFLCPGIYLFFCYVLLSCMGNEAVKCHGHSEVIIEPRAAGGIGWGRKMKGKNERVCRQWYCPTQEWQKLVNLLSINPPKRISVGSLIIAYWKPISHSPWGWTNRCVCVCVCHQILKLGCVPLHLIPMPKALLSACMTHNRLSTTFLCNLSAPIFNARS